MASQARHERVSPQGQKRNGLALTLILSPWRGKTSGSFGAKRCSFEIGAARAVIVERTAERSRDWRYRFLLRGGEGQDEGEPFNQLHHFLIDPYSTAFVEGPLFLNRRVLRLMKS